MKIDLNKTFLLNTGTNRACYIHPENQDICIKIDISQNTKETKRELRYYRFLTNKNISYKMISKYYGSIDTNLGRGEMFELIRDYNGDVSQELDKYLKMPLQEQEKQYIKKLLDEFKEYIFENKIYIKDLNSVNVVYQRLDKNSARLVVIDGLAHSWYIHLFCQFSDAFLKKKITKSWTKFLSTIKL